MISRIISYIKESKSELEKVSWPSRKEALRHTGIVIAISAAVAVFLGAIDYLLTTGVEKIIQ